MAFLNAFVGSAETRELAKERGWRKGEGERERERERLERERAALGSRQKESANFAQPKKEGVECRHRSCKPAKIRVDAATFRAAETYYC